MENLFNKSNIQEEEEEEEEEEKDSQSICLVNKSLTNAEWSLINQISNEYDLWALNGRKYQLNKSLLKNSSLIDFLNEEEQVYKNLILFYKKIPHFKQMNIEDQILLIKSNLTHLIHIHHVLKDNFYENPIIDFHMTQWINSDFHQQMSKTRHSLNCFVQHPIVLKLTLVTLIFITNLSKLPSKQLSIEFVNKDLLIKNQNLFGRLLWIYLNRIYNEKDSIKAFSTLIFQYLRYQLLMDQLDRIISNQNHFDHFHPLIKSILR